ncbi:phosphotransferase [Pseudonocardia spinosispora]|uniref:phosphotransferase n=1 Tax=Pseudonocardia spinosispora TaxID=103441 RepID=UPI0003F88482|nr:phosphotransferase [Pseudonocardia spinosispora]
MHASDLNAAWLDAVLPRADPASRITDIETCRIGTGQVADSYQVRLRSEPSDILRPQSLVAKLTSDSPQSRAAGRSETNYLREVRFYQEVAPRVAARVPACHHAEIDTNGTEFVLLLEDLSPARPGNQLTGCSVEETELALRHAARFHAPFWGDRSLRGVDWLDISESYWARFEEMLPTWFAGFVERYAPRMDAADLEAAQHFVDRIGAYYRRLRACPFTVQHGDFRPDNVLFDIHDEPGTLAIVDWQTVILGPASVDVAYFVGGALDQETRRRHEDRLLQIYHAELRAQGVDYDSDRLAADYAVSCFANLVIGVAAAMLVERTARGDDLFTSMVTNAVRQAQDRHGFHELETTSEV